MEPYSMVNMSVNLDKNFDKGVFDTIKTALLFTFNRKKSTKIGFGQD